MPDCKIAGARDDLTVDDDVARVAVGPRRAVPPAAPAVWPVAMVAPALVATSVPAGTVMLEADAAPAGAIAAAASSPAAARPSDASER